MSYLPLKDTPSTRVIFETDLCCDVDDVGALVLLCDAVKRFGINLAGISVNVNGKNSAAACSALLRRMDMPSLPICVWDGETPSSGNKSSYVDYLAGCLEPDRKEKLIVYSPVDFYREILTDSENGGVVIISVGFFCCMDTALCRLPELFCRKVRSVVAMAGTFREKPGYKEFNIRCMPEYAHHFVSEYPGEMIFIASETGDRVITDLNGCAGCDSDLIFESYRIYTGGKLTRPSWDLVTVDFAVNGVNERYSLSERGTATVTADSESFFTVHDGGRHAYVNFELTHEEIGVIITDMLKDAAGLK